MKLIGLLDCNNFFVSCERLFRPDLMNKPVAVLSSNDGVIVARSQEVKDMGVPMGLPLFQAKKLVNMDKITFFSSNFTLYRDLSDRVMNVLAKEVGKIDIYSIDEAFFEVENVSLEELSLLRTRIIKKVGIPVSIGVAATKTLAKEASQIGKKEEGICLLHQEEWSERALQTPCGSIWGLGRATVTKLAELKVTTAGEFMALERQFVRKNFGVGGERIYDELHGVRVHELGSRAHESNKSIMSTRSFAEASHNILELQSAVAYHVSQVAIKLRQQQAAATMMHLELRASRHSDFSHRAGGTEIILDTPTQSTQKLTRLALEAVKKIYDSEIPYKKAGIVVSGLIPEDYVSATLFDEQDNKVKDKLDEVLDIVQNRYGFSALHSAAVLPSHDKSSAKLRSSAYTTTWKDIPTIRA